MTPKYSYVVREDGKTFGAFLVMRDGDEALIGRWSDRAGAQEYVDEMNRRVAAPQADLDRRRHAFASSQEDE